MATFNGNIRRGDVILVNFPYTTGSDKKIRPALVIKEKEDLVSICQITTKSGRGGEISLDREDFKQGGLNAKSYIIPTGIITITKDEVIRKKGSIKHSKLEEVIKELERFIKEESSIKGKIFKVEKIYTEEQDSIERKVLVINERQSNIITCIIIDETEIKNLEEKITLKQEDLIEGKIENSYIDTELICIHKSLIIEEVGLIKKEKIEEVIEKFIGKCKENKKVLSDPISKAMERPKPPLHPNPIKKIEPKSLNY